MYQGVQREILLEWAVESLYPLGIEKRADMRLILWLMEMRPRRKNRQYRAVQTRQRLHAPHWSQSLQHKMCQDCKHMAGVSCHF